jgi:hypothetical protein
MSRVGNQSIKRGYIPNGSIYCPTRVNEYMGSGEINLHNMYDRQALYFQNHIPEVYEGL